MHTPLLQFAQSSADMGMIIGSSSFRKYNASKATAANTQQTYTAKVHKRMTANHVQEVLRLL
jgi:hypothetical protein